MSYLINITKHFKYTMMLMYDVPIIVLYIYVHL